MLGIHCVALGKCQSEDFPWDWKKTREGRSESQQKWTEEIRTENRAVDKSQEKESVKGRSQNREVDRREQSTEVGGSRESREQATARMYGHRCWVGQREKMSQHFWWPCRNFARIHTHDSSQNARKVSQTSPFLCLDLTQVRVCLFSFLPTLSVVYVVFCVSVKKCEIPLVDERNH